MDTFANRLKKALELRNMTQATLATEMNVNAGTISNYIHAKYEPKMDALEQLSKILKVTPAWLMGFDVPVSNTNITIADEDDYVEIPTIGEIAASYNVVANSDVELTPAHLPKSKLKGHSVSEFISLKVKGDSMLPEYKNGDLVVILSQPRPDYDGQVGAVIYDGEIGTLKKIYYNDSNITLTPINPYYPPIEITDIDNYHYIGKPFYLERYYEE